MRMSCNGCRVLRKGCSENCSIRPCLQWIKSPESQANATVFLAKFYGRAGLMNLINAGPEHLRPAIFRSLLYEACGRIANPIYGSVGLLWSGSWQLCQTAVEAVLQGSAITQITSDTAETNNGPPFKAYDIRHISKDENSPRSNDLHRVIKTRGRFKRTGSKTKVPVPIASRVCVGSSEDESGHESHESGVSHQSEVVHVEGECHDDVEESLGSAETPNDDVDKKLELELELTLGHEVVDRRSNTNKGKEMVKDEGVGVELRLDYSV
nr:hypothetical protein [Tanacetum cinerariifolium]